MRNNTLLDWSSERDTHSSLYEFLATDYDIRDLAYKIVATQNSKLNKISLKRIGDNVA